MSQTHSVLSRGYNLCKAHGGGNNERALFQRSVISKLSRLELEDKFFRAIENNVMLKKQNNFQEEKLKLLGTKLLRLSEQLKREASQNLAFQPFEKLVKDQEERIEELEKTKKELQQKISSLKSESSVHLYNKSVGITRRRHSGRRGDTRGGQWDSNKHATEDAESEKPTHENAEQTEVGEISESSQEYDVHQREDDSNTNNNTDVGKVMEPLQQDGDKERHDDITNTNTKLTQRTSTTSPPSPNVLQGRSVLVQTDLTKTYFDDLSKKLLEKESLILDLQNQLKLSKIKQNVIGEVENLFNIINQKSTKDNMKRKKKSITKKDSHSSSCTVEQLLQELQMERIQLETQKTINEQLMQKLSEMQCKLDNLNIIHSYETSGNFVDSNIQIDNLSRVPSSPTTVTAEDTTPPPVRGREEPVADNTSVIEDDRTSLNRDVDDNVDVKTVAGSVGGSGDSGQGRVKEDTVESSQDKGAEVQENLKENAELKNEDTYLKEGKEDISSDNEDEKIADVNLELGEVVMDGSDKSGHGVDDATYDVSSASSVTPSVGSSCGSSCGQCLSDGEVPREISEKLVSEESNKSSPLYLHVPKQPSQAITNTNSIMSLEKGEVTPYEVKAELTLKAIFQQLETCKMLIAAPSSSNNKLNIVM